MTKRGGKWLRLSMTKHTAHRPNDKPDLHRDTRPREEFAYEGQSYGSRVIALTDSEPTNCLMMV